VTEVRDLDEAERIARERAAQAAQAAALAAFARAWFPEATAVEGHGYPVGQGQVRFRLPGLMADVIWRFTEPEVVRLQGRDHDTWRARYADRRRPSLASLAPRLDYAFPAEPGG